MKRVWTSILCFNATLLIAAWLAGVPTVWGPVRMLCGGLLAVVLPGAAWLGLFGGRPLDLPRLFLAIVGISSLWTLAAFALMASTVGAPSRPLLLIVVALGVNSGLLIAGPRPRLRAHAPTSLLVLVGVAAFLVTSLSATKLVPPLEDHDMEVRSTAYGLASRFKPYFQTNREVYLAMPHPILFHFHVASSLIFTGDIDTTRPSYESAIAAEHASRVGDEFPWLERWRADFETFLNDPALEGTRAPSVVFAVLGLTLLAEAVFRLTQSRPASVAGAVLYASMPETLVRSAYAGYFSVAVFAMLVCASLFDVRGDGDETHAHWRAQLVWLAAAGAFAALVDHKTVILILGVGALAAIDCVLNVSRSATRNAKSLWRAFDRRALALIIGFASGTLAWWGYGLAVDRAAFVRDHLRMHIAHRILLNDLRLTPDADRYAPSMAELWIEFNEHTGYIFLPVAFAGIIIWLKRGRRLELTTVMGAWTLVGTVLYTQTDWRQTKHLMDVLAPLVIAAVALAAGNHDEGPTTWKQKLAGAALLAAFAVNFSTNVHLARDFGSLTISGASDVDGW